MKQNKLMVFMAIGFELVALILVGLWMGNWIDGKYGTGGLGVIGGIMVALVGWILHIIGLVRQFEKNEPGEE